MSRIRQEEHAHEAEAGASRPAHRHAEANTPAEAEQDLATRRASHAQADTSRSDVDDLYALSNAYKKGTPARVGAKSAAAAAVGLVLAPMFSRGALPVTAALGAVNAGSFVALYDTLREAMTSLTVADSPVNSAIAGFISGYAWNGLLWQCRTRAVAGGVLVGALAAAAHAVLPTFAADRAVTETLLDAGLLSDPDGAWRARVSEPPVLPPFSLAAARGALGRFALRWLPVREVGEEEYARRVAVNPPMTIVMHPCASSFICTSPACRARSACMHGGAKTAPASNNSD
jgi:hypothetical protein